MRKPHRPRMALAALRDVLPRGGTLPADEWDRRHWAILAVTWLAMPGVLVYAAVAEVEPLHDGAFILALVLFSAVASVARLSRPVRAVAAALMLSSLAGLLVHLSGGAAAAHLSYFVVVMVLALYEQWAPLLLAMSFVVLNDGLVGSLDHNAAFNPADPWGSAAVEVFFVALASAARVLSWRMNETLRAGLQDREELHRQIVETANDGIWMLGADGRTNFVNQRMADMLGYTVEEMLGTTMFDFIDDEGFAAAAAAFAGERPADAGQIAVRYRRKDGSPLWVLMSESELMDERLNYAGGLAMVTDVTQMREADADARRLATIVENATDPIITTVGDVITTWNLAAQELLGYTAEEIIGRPVADIMPPERDRGDIKAVGDRVRAGQVVTVDDSELLCKSGERVPVNKRLSPLKGRNGEILGVSAFYRDLRDQVRVRAEKEQLELQLHQSQRLETVGQLAGGIAHDFNNLLAVILNYSDFLRDEVPDGQAREDVEEIHRAATRAATLTRQLLVFSRREVARPKVLDVNEVVSVAGNLLRRTIGEHIELTTQLDEDLGRVKIDEGQLEQVLVNLVVNARDAMPDGGSLAIETANVTLDGATAGAWGALTAGSYARLCVTDTGVGMPPEVVERAFEPFYTTKAVGEGTGLGLATVYGIVNNAHGHALIYSEEGRGTAVKVYLPLVDGDGELLDVPDEGAGRGLAGQGETILLVEDEDAVRESTRRILVENGYEVLTASNGAQALEICEERTSIDLVVTDVVMPVMSGAELAGSLPDATRIIYMSGYTGHHALPEGHGTLVEKPFGSAKLLSEVSQALSRG